jgi:hypothetical protein
MRPLFYRFSFHRAHYSGTFGFQIPALRVHSGRTGSTIPALVRSLGASERGAVSFALLSASLLWFFGRQEYKK